MGRKTKVREASYKAGASASVQLVESGSDRYRYWQGFAITPLGIVGIYMQDDLFSLRVVHEGRVYSHREDRSTSKRGLAVACTKFITRVVRGEVDA